jgi:serine/threonine protein kinase
LTLKDLFNGKSYLDIFRKNQLCEIDFEFIKQKYNFPAPTLDLLEKMLKIDPKERITAAKALKHNFF